MTPDSNNYPTPNINSSHISDNNNYPVVEDNFKENNNIRINHPSIFDSESYKKCKEKANSYRRKSDA